MNLDDIVVKIKTDLSEFKTEEASRQVSDFGTKTEASAKKIGAVDQALGKAGGAVKSFADGLKSAYGSLDGLTRAQQGTIRNLEDINVATRLSGKELATYIALRKSNTAADSEAGIVIKNLVAAQYAGAAATASWRNLWGVFGQSAAGATGALSANGAAARAMAAEHASATSVSHGLKDALRVVAPAAAAAGFSLGDVGKVATAAKVSLLGLGAALLGTIAVGLAKAGDEAITATKRFSDLLGSKDAGKNIFAGLEQGAEKLGVSVGTLTGPMEAVLKVMQEQNRIGGMVYAPGSKSAGEFAASTKTLEDGLISLGGFLRADIGDGARFGAVFGSITQALTESGKLTRKIFTDIESASPATANAIARVFRGTDAATFKTQVDQLGISFLDVLRAMARIGPESDAALAQARSGAGTTESAIDRVVHAAERLWKSLAGDPGVKSGLDLVVQGMDYLREHTELAKVAVIALAGGLALAFGGPIIGAIVAVGAAVVAFGGQLKGVYDWIGNLISKWKEWLTVGSQQPRAPQMGGGSSQPSSSSGPPGYVESLINSYRNGFSGGEYYPTSGNYLPDMGGGNYTSTAPSVGDFSAGDNSPYFASGTGSIRRVPSGFPNDSYGINLTSGEEFAVAPVGQRLRNMIANSPIRVGDSSQRNFMSGTGSGIDLSITPAGSALLTMVRSNEEVFAKVGLSLTGIRQALAGSGAGNLKDTLTVTRAETVAAILRSQSAITQQTGVSGSNTVRAIDSSTGAITTAVNNSAAAITGAVAASGGGGGGGSGGGFKTGRPMDENDPLGMGSLRKALGTTGDYGVSAPPRAAPQNPAGFPPQFNAGSKSVQGMNEFGRVGAAPDAWSGYQPGGSASQQFGSQGGFYIPDYLNPDAPGYYDPGGIGGGDYSFARPGEFTVPQKYKNDSFRAQLNLDGGETLSVRRYGRDDPRSGRSQSGGNLPPINVTIMTKDLKSFVSSESQVAQVMRGVIEQAQRHR